MKKSIAGILFLALMVGACEKAPDQLASLDDMISFGVATEYENEPETRTEYSGLDQSNSIITSSSTYERIDWVADYDRIRILCPQAVDQSGDPNTSGDYQMGAPAASGRQSRAYANPVTGTSPFFWGTGDHYFYALYPAPGTTSNYFDAEVSEIDSHIEMSGNTASITGIIPASQTVVKNDTIYKPNMNYAYMYAALKTAQTANGNLTLTFRPLVTAFQFSLLALDDAMAGKDLKSLTLSSSSTSLYGSFTAAINAANTTTPATVTPTDGTTGNAITVTFPDGTRLSKTQYSDVTVLALGVGQTNLTLKLTFGDDSTRELDLTHLVSGVSTPITVNACKKAYFKLGVPGSSVVSYSIDPLVDVTLSHFGGEAMLSGSTPFKSYKTVNGGEPEFVAYELKYSKDGGATWGDTEPDWFTTPIITRSDDKAETDGNSIYLDMKPQTNSAIDPHHVELANRTPKANFDLSTLNLATGETVLPSTANCYVVQAPGTYKFPLVYGNGLKEGLVNTSAYISSQGSSSLTLLNYLDHRDQPITSPYIAVQQSGKPMDVVLVWSDSGGLVSNYAITGTTAESKYLTFAVDTTYITQGNAVLGVRVDDNGDGVPETIAWSWHIWVTDEDLGPSGQKRSVRAEGAEGNLFAQFNVGRVAGKTETYLTRNYLVKAVQTEGGLESEPATITQTAYEIVTDENYTLFQWGRKDPQPASDGKVGSGLFRLYYSDDPDNLLPQCVSDQMTVGYSIQHPNIRRCDSSPDAEPSLYNDEWDWSTEHYSNLWTSAAYESLVQRTHTVKTIYDPSPVGYKVPDTDSFDGLDNITFGEPKHWGYGSWSNEQTQWVAKDEVVAGLPAVHPAGVLIASTGLFLPASGFLRETYADLGSYGCYNHSMSLNNGYCYDTFFDGPDNFWLTYWRKGIAAQDRQRCTCLLCQVDDNF